MFITTGQSSDKDFVNCQVLIGSFYLGRISKQFLKNENVKALILDADSVKMQTDF